MKVLVAAVVVGGCAHSPAYKAYVDAELGAHVKPARRVSAPATLEGQPWRVGQWAVYRGHADGGPQFYERRSVVAIDACGVWFEVLEVTYEHWRQRTFCLRADPPFTLQYVIEQIDGGAVVTTDLRCNCSRDRYDGGLRDAVIPAVLPDSQREDLFVPAGHFAEAVRRFDQGVTTWLHPDVPLEAIVKRVYANRDELELVDYGEHHDFSGIPAIVAAATPKPKPRPALFIGIGAGLKWLGASSHEPRNAGMGYWVTYGSRVSRTFDVSLDVSAVDLIGASTSEEAGLFLTSVRWTPFRQEPDDPRALLGSLYLHADLGYAEIDRQQDANPTTVHGFAAGGGIGFESVHGREYGIAAELNDRIGFYDSGEGRRHNVTLGFVIRVFVPFPFGL